MAELLDIVNDRDEVIGQVERNDRANEGHIIRMVFVGFYTPDKEIILQRRSRRKRSSPGRLTSTVSGHVSSGQSYDEAAIRETYEETGVVIDRPLMVPLGVLLGGNAMRAVYAYPYSDPISRLQIEKDEGDGFVKIPVERLTRERFAKQDLYTPFINSDAGTVLLDYIQHVSG